MTSQPSINTIQKIYIAYYGRPADTEGLEYWLGRMADDGDDFYHAINAFGASKEYIERYSELSNQELINNIYLQAFNRPADDVGMSYYLERLDSGKASLATIALQIVDGAQASDLAFLNSKIEVANTFTETLADSGKNFYGTSAIDEAVLLINSVTPTSGNSSNVLITHLTEKLMHKPESYHSNYEGEGYQTRKELDWDQDGKIDRVDLDTYDIEGRLIAQSKNGYDYSWHYNDQGLLIREESDLWGDSTPEYVWDYEYDEKQQLIRAARDTNADGQPNKILTYQYDTQGNLQLESEDTNGDGIANHIAEYVYDEQGNKTFASIDSNGDGIANSIVLSEYDAMGNKLRSTEDTDGDGILNAIFTATFNSQGEQINQRDELDWNDDGIVDYILEYEFALDSLPQSDTPSDQTNTITADHSNNIMAPDPLPPSDPDNISSKKVDINGDGTFDFYLSYDFDSKGSMTYRGVDVNETWIEAWDNYTEGYNYVQMGPYGHFESFTELSWGYQYNDNDQVIRKEFDSGNNDSIDTVEYYEYNERGNTTSFQRDLDNDGVSDWVLSYNYNNEGLLQSEMIDSGNNGEINSIITYQYNDSNKLTNKTFDYENDGLIDFTLNFGYDTNNNLISEKHTKQLPTIAEGNQPTINYNPNEYENAYIYSWQYDESGNLTRYDQDLDADGSIEYSLYQEYNDTGDLILIGESGSEYTGPVIYY